MPEAVRSVMLGGRGLLRWPGGEEHVNYRVTVGLDSAINAIHVGPPAPEILGRPRRHGGIFLYMQGGRRIALNVAPNGYLSADGPIERGSDDLGWWADNTPWVPSEASDRFTLAMKAGSMQIFESHATPEEAEAAYGARQSVEIAEIRPPFGKPIRLK
jgi:hypothetical protein